MTEQYSSIAPATIEHDLPCPHCAYNLRGLAGPRVQCPECGAAIDAAALSTARQQARETLGTLQADMLTAPVALLMLVCVLPLVAMVGGSMLGPTVGLIMTGAMGVLLLVPWLMRTIRACQRLPGPGGVRLVFVGQGVLIGLVVSALGVLGAGTWIGVQLWAGRWAEAGLALLWLVAGGLLAGGFLWAHRRVTAALRRRFL